MTQEIPSASEIEAIERWEAGETPCFSTGMCDTLTAGYGELDECGYFEFQLPYPSEQWMPKNQHQMSLYQSIVAVSDRIHNRRSEQDVFNKLIEEVGELAIEIAVHNKRTYKKGGPDGIVGEAIDAINCLVDLIHLHRPDFTESDFAKIAYEKQLKWERFHLQQVEEEKIRNLNKPSGWSDKGI